MPNRYPMIELLEKISRNQPFPLKLDSGPVHFILPLAPKEHYDQQVAAAREAERPSPFAGIRNLRQMMTEAVYRFPVKLSVSPPVNLTTETSSDMENALVFNGSEVTGEAGSTHARVLQYLADLDHVAQAIPCLNNYPERVKAAVQRLTELDGQQFRSLYADIQDDTARNLLLKALPSSVARAPTREALDPWLNVFSMYLDDPDQALERIEDKRRTCKDYLEKVAGEAKDYDRYIKSFVGLDLYANLTAVGGEGRNHQAPVWLHNLQGLDDAAAPELGEILTSISSPGQSRGIVAIPGWMDPEGQCRQVLNAWLNNTSHSYFAVIDVVDMPDWAEDNSSAWFDQVANTAAPQGNQRAHARTLTFFPPLHRTIGGRPHTISAVYAGAALLSRAQLGYNPAYPQMPLEMGVVEYISGTVGQSTTLRSLTSDRRERLNEIGINTIGLDHYAPANRDYFIMEPGVTLSLQQSRSHFVHEVITALLEDVTQEYIRWYKQGRLGTPQKCIEDLKKTLFSELERQGYISELNLQLTVQANGHIDLTVEFKMLTIIESVSITIQNTSFERDPKGHEPIVATV